MARAHNFSQYTFRAPHYCDYCRNFLWGLVHQVYLFACIIFLFLVASFRSSNLYKNLFYFFVNNSFLGSSMCGLRLCSSQEMLGEDSARLSARGQIREANVRCRFDNSLLGASDCNSSCCAAMHQGGNELTVAFSLLFYFQVESRGLTVEGIYRVSGSHDHMERLRVQFDSQQNVDLSQVRFKIYILSLYWFFCTSLMRLLLNSGERLILFCPTLTCFLYPGFRISHLWAFPSKIET